MTTARELTVGVIGLGAMGTPMTHRLLAGHPAGAIRIGGRRRAHPELEAAGARWCDTAAELADGADAVLLMLPDLPEIEDVLAGTDGLLAGVTGPLLLLIGSTSSPDGVRALAERLAKETGSQVRVVDCPVSGGPEGAEAGTLSIMLGGAGPELELAERVLGPCGRPVPLGPLGAGQVAKACNQLIVGSTILALGEAAVLAERSGLDLARLFDLFSGGYADSTVLRSRGMRMVNQDYDPLSRARYLAKDLGFAQAVAAGTDTRPVLLPAVAAAFTELVAGGHGDRDITATRLLTEHRESVPDGSISDRGGG